MEQPALWEQINSPISLTVDHGPDGKPHTFHWPAMGPTPDQRLYDPWRTSIPTLRCPSDNDVSLDFGFTNYAACLGDSAFWSMRGRKVMWMPLDDKSQPGNATDGPRNGNDGTPNLVSWASESRAAERGMFVTHHRQRFDDVTDGLSHTIMAGEITTFDSSNPFTNVPDLSRPPISARDDPRACTTAAFAGVGGSGLGGWVVGPAKRRGYCWADFHVAATGFHTILPPGGSNCVGQAKGETGAMTANSNHQGGTHVLMGDGAVVFMTQSVDHNAGGPPGMAYRAGKGEQAPRSKSPYGFWGALGTRSSGEVIEEKEYIEFWDQLCSIYHDAKELNKDVADSVAGDPLHTIEGRRAVIENLQSRIAELCDRRDETILTAKATAKAKPVVEPTLSHVATFINLQRELTNNVACLFVFIEHPEVERWRTAGVSRFQKELDLLKTNLPPPTGSTPA